MDSLELKQILILREINWVLEKFNNDKNREGLDLTSFNKYLESLSILEESALFHIIFRITLVFIVWNIYSVSKWGYKIF